MNKVVSIIGLLLCLLVLNGGTSYGEQSKSVFVQHLQNMENSIFQLQIFDATAIPKPPFVSLKKVSMGSGFIVFANKEKTIVVTAKHVVRSEFEGLRQVKTIFKGTTYKATYVSEASDMDAAYVIFPHIPGAKAVVMNLSPDNSIIEALCFGFGQQIHLKDEIQAITMTHGKLSRKVCKEVVLGPKHDYTKNVMHGTPTVIFGYSGGPITDLQNQVVGINIAFSGTTSIFVDIRAVYNWLRHNFGTSLKPVKVPYDANFEVFNWPGLKRIALDEHRDTFASKLGTKSFYELKKAMRLEAEKKLVKQGKVMMTQLLDKPNYKWLAFETLVMVDGKPYMVRSATLDARYVTPFRYSNILAGKKNTYIYMCGPGWEVTIYLSPIEDPEMVQDMLNVHKEAAPQLEDADKR